jgi:hypothetical protein
MNIRNLKVGIEPPIGRTSFLTPSTYPLDIAYILNFSSNGVLLYPRKHRYIISLYHNGCEGFILLITHGRTWQRFES